MIAAAVQMLAPYIRNFVLETPGALVVPAPYDIVLPPLRVYTFAQVTGRVIARTVGGSDIESTKSKESPGSEPPAKKQKLPFGGPGSSSGKVPPKVAEDDSDGEGEEMDGEEEEEEEGGDNDDDDDLAKLESLEEEFKSKTPTKRGRPKTKAKVKARMPS